MLLGRRHRVMARFSTGAVAPSLDGSTITLWARSLFDGFAETGGEGGNQIRPQQFSPFPSCTSPTAFLFPLRRLGCSSTESALWAPRVPGARQRWACERA